MLLEAELTVKCDTKDLAGVSEMDSISTQLEGVWDCCDILAVKADDFSLVNTTIYDHSPSVGPSSAPID